MVRLSRATRQQRGEPAAAAGRALLQQERPVIARLELHRLFREGVVLSQDDAIVAGFADPGARVMVTLTGLPSACSSAVKGRLGWMM